MSKEESVLSRFAIAARLAILLALLPAVQAAAAPDPAREAVSDIYNRIQARDCGAAVERLKAGLKQGYPRVSLLAGSMVENGICVKANWANAVTFYVQAHQGGLPEAAERLAAGYADPANGPDAAAALWWSLRTRGARNEVCAVSKEAETDPDRFVKELEAWPHNRLAACNYITGVISTISAEVKYPRQAQAHGLGGEVTLRFMPAVPRIDVKKDGIEEYQLFGWVDGDLARDREAKPVAGAFETTLRELARRALRRYPQPPGIAAGSQVVVKFRFSLE
jgi:hypothetical protein